MGPVERNRVKRLLREAFGQESERLPVGMDAVVIARPGAGELAERQGLHGIHAALREPVDRIAAGGAQSVVDGGEAADREPVEAE